MTVGIAIKCKDGIVIACDSLATFSRGVPVKRYSNKVHVLDHPALAYPVAVVGAGMTAFIDKFIDSARREAIGLAAQGRDEKLDVIDFGELVCEPLVAALFKKYVIERNKFFGAPIGEFSLFIIVVGATRNGNLRAFFVHPDGMTESIADYGTVGSGAGYAELFLRPLMFELPETSAEEAACLAAYAVKGVELMDPNVGGMSNISIVRMEEVKSKDKVERTLRVIPYENEGVIVNASKGMEDILKRMGKDMRSLIAPAKKQKEKRSTK